MKFGFSVVVVTSLAFAIEGAVRSPRANRRQRETREQTRGRRGNPNETEQRQLKKNGGGGGGGEGECPKFIKNGSVVPLDMQCSKDSDCNCAASGVANCCCVWTNAFGHGYCGDQFGCNDYGRCLGNPPPPPASVNNEEEIKIYSTANGEVIETGNVKVTVANDGKETIQIASEQKVQSRRPQGSPGSANNKPMGKGTTAKDDGCGYYSFDVHCNHANSGGSDRYSTTDKITAQIYSYNYDRGNYYLIDTQEFNGFCSSGSETIWLEDEECDVERIDLSTDGDSALLIDYIELWDDDANAVVYQWGVKNGGAWCLSTDANDNQNYWGSFLEGGQCYTSIRFDND